jgi:UDP-N-acetylglucosamine 2-epimerase
MPEEHNRVETDRLASLLLCPDERSAQTLTGEGVDGHVEVVGDVMLDATLRLAPIARERSRALERFAVVPGRYVLATIHREANVEPARLDAIVEALGRLAEPVVFPAHPRTRSRLDEVPTNVALAEPLGYLDLAALASQARVIVTDSGGLQKEAYWYGVPCVTMRPSTEWVDTVELGANVLVDDNPDRIVAAAAAAALPRGLPALYGDGHASERIAEVLVTLSA